MNVPYLEAIGCVCHAAAKHFVIRGHISSPRIVVRETVTVSVCTTTFGTSEQERQPSPAPAQAQAVGGAELGRWSTSRPWKETHNG